MFHLRLLSNLRRKGSVVEHDLNLGYLSLKLGNGFGKDLRHVDLSSGLLLRIILLVESSKICLV